jgi:hypothetical protein
MTIYDNLTGHSSAVIKLKFTPNSDTLASCENSYPSIFLWNLTNRRVMSHFLGHFAKVTSIAFSPDGKQLASGSWDNTVIIWDIEEGKSSVLLTHPSGINTLDFSRNGLLAAGCQDSTIYLWNVTQNLLLSTLSAHDQQVLTVKFSPDNTLLASGGEDNTVILWGIDPLPLDTDFDSIPDSWENQNNLDPLNFSDSLIDLDGDGLMNVMECLLDTKPRVNDSDGDGLHDLWEFLYNSNQTINDASDDSDRDGLPNWFECNYGLNGLIDDTMMDLDGDNLINILELEFDSSPILVDTDYDGMPDGYEFNMSRKVGTRYVGLWPTINDSYSDLDGDEIPNLIEFQLGLNASDETDALGDKDLDDMTNLWEYQMGLDATNDSDAALDLDRDGISNLYEFQMGLNANNDSDAALDLDGDGMSNLYEFQNNLDAMDPNDAVLDKDEDGIPNLYEAQIGLNASDPRDAIEDYDNDTMSNVWEFQMGLNAANPSDADEDSDNDGIINRLESEYGFNATDPTDATLDSDHDGISNRDECIAGTNPRDFWSFPLLSFSVVHRIIGSLILIAAFSVFFILIYQRNQRRKLIAVFKTPDYKTALRVRKTGLSDYPALLQAETKAKEIMEEASAAYYQGNVTEGIQKYEEALESLEQLNSTPLVAHTTFYLAQIYKEQGTLTEDHPIFQRFPKISDDDPVVTVLSHMLQALLAETKNNWGEAEKAWQDAKQVEGLETNLQMICQGGLAESALRTWFYNQNYQNQAQVLTRLDEWEKTAKVDSEKGNLCSVYLLRARLALASYRFSEVEQWLDQCRLTAEEAGMPFYRDLALLERDRLLEHKERVELLFEADKLLSPEDRGKIIQQYIKKAVLTARGARNSVTKTE